MKRKKLWVTLALVNLCIVALLGATLRTKFLFPIPFIDYKNFLSAHSHFAFGGWITLALMILYIDNLLEEGQKQKRIYQWILWGIELTSLGMTMSFPFRGYAFFSILFSTVFIFFTFGFSWVAIVINETIPLIEGIGLMFYSTNPSYPWLLWAAALLLLIGALMMLVSRLRYSSIQQ